MTNFSEEQKSHLAGRCVRYIRPHSWTLWVPVVRSPVPILPISGYKVLPEVQERLCVRCGIAQRKVISIDQPKRS